MTEMKFNSTANILSVASLVWALAACTALDSEKFEFTEFGISEKEIVFPAKAEYKDGKVVTDLKTVVEVLSNQNCTVSYFDSEVDWMRIRDCGTWQICRQIAFDGDGKFRIECDVNGDYARSVKLIVSCPSKVDTIFVKQEGKRTPSVKLASSSLVLDGDAAGIGSVAFETNVDDVSAIQTVISYTGAEEWVSSLTVGEGKIDVAYTANPDASSLRTASVEVFYEDGFGVRYGQTLYLIQKTSDNGLGKTMSFSDVRALVSAGKSVEIEDYVIIEGYVVSDRSGGNSGENEKVSTTGTDHSSCRKKFCIESLDGSCGFLVETVSEEDNIFERYDKATLLLKGTALRLDTDPDRYGISGFTSANIIGRESGLSSAVPGKEKSISELTDADIYTQVTLKDCEFPVRKGPLAPVNEAYTLASGKGFLSKYPRLVRDIDGSSIYTLTNTTCTYRRDGVRLPYGSGTLTGVIVHEQFTGYAYADAYDDDLNGDIGRYQIRHQSWSDIAFDREKSFSTILAEFRYASEFKTVDGRSCFYATEGQPEASFCHTSGTAVVHCPSTANYIGQVGTSAGTEPFKNHIGCDASLEEPLGYSFPSGYVFDYSKTNSDGKGKVGSNGANTIDGVSSKIYDGWRALTWWKDDTSGAESWLISFSTSGISASHLSMQLSTCGAVTDAVGTTPYFWSAWWSLTGDLSDDGAWTKIADYVVPDGIVNGAERDWQLPAMKQYDFPLPLEVLGQEKVYIRLRPASRVANGADFCEGIAPSGKKSGNGIDYFAIRYN